jgi:hypothetical protein
MPREKKEIDYNSPDFQLKPISQASWLFQQGYLTRELLNIRSNQPRKAKVICQVDKCGHKWEVQIKMINNTGNYWLHMEKHHGNKIPKNKKDLERAESECKFYLLKFFNFILISLAERQSMGTIESAFSMKKRKLTEFSENGFFQKLLQFLIANNISIRAGYSQSIIELLNYCRENQGYVFLFPN